MSWRGCIDRRVVECRIIGVLGSRGIKEVIRVLAEEGRCGCGRDGRVLCFGFVC
jgi:hypothetical protein